MKHLSYAIMISFFVTVTFTQVYTGESSDSVKNEKIDFKEWRKLRDAVFAKKGHLFEETFSERYHDPSPEGVEKLVEEFDTVDTMGRAQTYDNWEESPEPARLKIVIDKKAFWLKQGAITRIILSHKNVSQEYEDTERCSNL